MPLLLTISQPAMNLITKGEMTSDLKKTLKKKTWLELISVSDELILIRISSINSIQEITEEKKAEFERSAKGEKPIIQKPVFAIPKKREN